MLTSSSSSSPSSFQITETRARYDAAKKTLAEKQAELNRCSKEIKALEAAREKAAKCQQSASLEARKLTHKLKEWEKDAKDAVLTKERLVKNHPWIEREREFFGRAGSDFDFAANDIQKQIKRLKQKKGEQVGNRFWKLVIYLYYLLFCIIYLRLLTHKNLCL